MVGFGKSDKYINIDDYSHQMHVDIITNLIRELDLTDMTAHVHDWGGLVGLRVVAEEPDRFSRVIASNTGLIAPGRGLINDIRGFFLGPIFKLTIWLQGPATWEEFIGGSGFTNWIRYSRYTDNIDVGGVMQKKVRSFGIEMDQSVESTFRTTYLPKLLEAIRNQDKAYLAYRNISARSGDK